MTRDRLDEATLRLQRSIERLERAAEARVVRQEVADGAEEEVQRMTADRSRLAAELDTALTRAERLEGANREVSRRLVTAMEAIRDVLSRRA
ncbi:DUF4164 domain-containing protein [Aureimonas jatrophae]|jgi:hypothetical protein|uniref:DUF4164 family protein n=1 Tax=Aureimonas jatrophae TaxID=1166073 RepID=A0A1H0CGU7_9HYPH|nr:DUF4164 domain-containing protein [Aureimonas jatrophae]MBB3949228.1 hypothetical protein [Aureimonas jatrophae]SDN57100.1 protein of unknown function [Aureimonas jatrophae]